MLLLMLISQSKSNNINFVFLFGPRGRSVVVFFFLSVVVPLVCLLSKHTDHRLPSVLHQVSPLSGHRSNSLSLTLTSTLSCSPILSSLSLSRLISGLSVSWVSAYFVEEDKRTCWKFAAGACLERFIRFSSASLGGVRSVLHIDPLCRGKAWHRIVWGVWSLILAWGNTFSICSRTHAL